MSFVTSTPKRISTSWLCLEKCVSLQLDKFEGIKSYFISEKFSDQRFKRLKIYFKDPMPSVYLRFYQSTLPVFNNFKNMQQSEEPLICVMHDLQQKFMIKHTSKFIIPEVIQISYSNISEIDISRQPERRRRPFCRFANRCVTQQILQWSPSILYDRV